MADGAAPATLTLSGPAAGLRRQLGLQVSGTGAARTLTVRPRAAKVVRTTVRVTATNAYGRVTASLPLVVGTRKADKLRGTGLVDLILGMGGKDKIRTGAGDVVC
jgi:hypothetical protein